MLYITVGVIIIIPGVLFLRERETERSRAIPPAGTPSSSTHTTAC